MVSLSVTVTFDQLAEVPKNKFIIDIFVNHMRGYEFLYLKELIKVYQRVVRDHFEISLLILNEFKRINEILFPLKSSEYEIPEICFQGE